MTPQPPPPRTGRARELLAVLVLLLLAGLYFAVLELRKPYYFLWDDNASFYLPCYVYNYESLIGRGEIPHLNYHQYLGHTYLASGQTAVLYPPLYAGLAAARLGWADLRPAVDVLAVLHLMAAALGMFFLLRRFEIRRATAVAVSLLWMSFPFLVVVSRSWIFVAYAAAYLPWGLWTLERLLERPAAPRILAVAAVKALFFYQGYVQYCVLATLFEGVYLVLRLLGAGERAGWRRQAVAYGAALAATAALSAPLLVPMFHAKQVSAYRTGSLSFEEFISNSLDLGTFFSAQVFRMEPRAVHLSTGAIFYVGIPGLLVLLGLARSRRRRTFLIYGAVAVLALVLSTRAFGLMYHVPILGSFRWPFKSFLIVLAFFSVAAGGAFEACFSSPRRVARLAGAILLGAALAGNVAIVFSKALDAPFGPNRVDRDVAELRAEAEELFPLDRGRVVSLWMSPLEPRIERLLPFNYATLVGAYHLGGYDPLVSQENLELALRLEYSNIFRYEMSRGMLDYLSSWSVRFLTVPRSRIYPPIAELRPALHRFPQLRLSYSDDAIEVWENGAALPFAHFQGPPVSPVDVEWGPSSVLLATEGRGGWLRVNVAPLDWYEWTADGREMGAPSLDEGRHLMMEVPEGTREVELRYVPVTFRLGVFVLLAFGGSMAAMWLVRRVRVQSVRF